jgi:hypothetical protein
LRHSGFHKLQQRALAFWSVACVSHASSVEIAYRAIGEMNDASLQTRDIRL